MNKKLSSISMVSFIVNALIGIRVMTLSQVTAKYAKNDAWISVILDGFIFALVCNFLFWICEQYQGLNFPQIIEKVLGKVIGKIILICIVAYYIFLTGISIRSFAEGIKTFLLENTPLSVIIITFLMVVYYCMMMDIRTINIIFDILLPFVLLFVTILILLTLNIIEPKNLLPILGGGPIPVVKGTLASQNGIMAVFIFSYLLPYFDKPKETKKYIMWGVFISIVFATLLVIISIMAFGERELSYFAFPTLMLGKSIHLEFRIFERAETFFMAAWIPMTLANTVVAYIMTSLSIKQLFNSNKNNLIITIQLPILFAVAILIKNFSEIPRLVSIANISAIILASTTLGMLLTVTYFKKKRSKNNMF